MPAAALLASLDIAQRAAAAGLLLLVAALLARDHGRSLAARLGALFALGGAVFAVTSAAPVIAADPPWRAPLMALAQGDNLVFWLFARALFDDGFRLRPWHAGLWGADVGLALVCALVLQPIRSPLAAPLDAGLGVVALAFAVLAVAQTLASWPGDLVEPRRRTRVALVATGAGYIALTAIAGLSGLRDAQPQAVSAIAGVALLVIAAGVAWSFLGVAGGEALFAPPRAAAAPALLELDADDRRLLARVQHAMEVERLYRQDGLTIGALAAAHGVPEHRLRKLINRGLGHRNFAGFVNGRRIAEAKAALADPTQAEVPIVTIALDAGFASLGPFNRAFKAQTGTTPTAFRRAALDVPTTDPAAAPIPFPASRIPKSA